MDDQYPWDYHLTAIKTFIIEQPHLFEPAPLSLTNPPAPLVDSQIHHPGTFRGTFTLPLWHTYDGFDPATPHWFSSQRLLDSLEPMFWTLNAAFQKRHPQAYHACYIIYNSRHAPEYRHQDTRGNRCFESMRISVNLAMEKEKLGSGLHKAGWVVVQTFGKFDGGEILVQDRENGKIERREPLRPGEWFCIPAESEFGSLPFRGERIQIELFTPFLEPYAGPYSGVVGNVQAAKSGNGTGSGTKIGTRVEAGTGDQNAESNVTVSASLFSKQIAQDESTTPNSVSIPYPSTPKMSVQNPHMPPNPKTPEHPVSDGEGEGEVWESAKSHQSDLDGEENAAGEEDE